MPVYEEQLVVVKRLMLKERLRIRRVRTSETRLFQDTLRRERLVVDDPRNGGLVHEQFPSGEQYDPASRYGYRDAPNGDAEAAGYAEDDTGGTEKHEGGFLDNLRKALQ